MKTQETTTVKETQQLESEGATFMKPPAFALTTGAVNAKSGVEDPEQEANTVVLTSGQMTRLGEAKPKFIYWPNTPSSGVTLGIGYDIGGRDRASVVADLTAHGMAVEQANKIAAGAGLKGDAANQFVIANKKAIGPIPDAVAESLFRDTMASKRKEAKALATGKKASQNDAGDYVNARGREINDQVPEGTYVMTGEQWDRLHPAMLELLTDLKYQGAYYAYDRIAKVNAILIAHEGDDLAQFRGVATLFESDDDGEISYMDKYNDSFTTGEQSKNQEVFFGQSKAEMSRSWRRRNRVRYAFLLQVIKALESGKTVSMSDQPSLPRPTASPVAKAPAFAKGDQLLGSTETKGASLETAKAMDPATTESGVPSSEKMVKADLEAIATMADLFKEIGNGNGFPPALLAAIASRETGAGKLLDGNDCGPDGKRSGVMGVDDLAHSSPGNEDRKANIARAAAILAGLREEVKAKFPSWTAADQLLGAVTAYHQPQGFVATWDGKPIAGDDYASDIWARARHLAGLKMFSGLDPIPIVTAKEPSKESPEAGKRPAVKKGKLIAQSVGKGGVNHPDDVRAVLERLQKLNVITAAEAGIRDEAAVTTYVIRYQNMVFTSGIDGVIEPGKNTEKKLIDGELTKSVTPAPTPSKPKGKPKGNPEGRPKEGEKPKQGPRKSPKPVPVSGKPDYESIAERVNYGMKGGFLSGAGTDETGVGLALSELHRDATYINEFKAVYQAKYGADLLEHINGEFQNYLLLIYHGQLDEVMIWLTPKAEMSAGGTEKTEAKGDAISTWLAKEVQAGSIGETNKQYAELILEAAKLGLVTFNDEGKTTGEFQAGKGGCEDTFIKIKEGKPIGNGKKNEKGQDYFYPATEAMPILPVLHATIQGMVNDWNDSGRVGAATNLKLGSFMVWNAGDTPGIIRHTNHGIKARAIDMNMDSLGNDFSTPEAVSLVLNVLKNAPVGTYELGMPKQGLFFNASDFRKSTTKAIDGNHAYTKLKSEALRTQIETMLNSGYVLKVMIDANNHLHFSVGSGGADYLTKADIQ